jgi:hypothetical protein
MATDAFVVVMVVVANAAPENPIAAKTANPKTVFVMVDPSDLHEFLMSQPSPAKAWQLSGRDSNKFANVARKSHGWLPKPLARQPRRSFSKVVLVKPEAIAGVVLSVLCIRTKL